MPRARDMSRQLLLDVIPVPAPSLDNYVAGPNLEACTAVRALAPGRALYLWGPAGCGRTHLLKAASQAAPAGRYLAAGDAAQLQELAGAAPGAAMPTVIAIDDVHLMGEPARAALFALYNRWRESSATGHAFALAVAADRAPMAMELREDLRTRLGWDLIFRLEPLSDDEKLKALARQARERGLQQVAPEVLRWMLTHYERDMRRLAALLDALDRYSLANGRPITIPLLRAMLNEPDLRVQ
jgi:DnaA family protein